ncbi:hypothetical protein IWQ60_000052 [Tieghemiomyces parasiticus]|uniref:Uncharacterized protein n=1 Tax=Tieghemiomyces parasiticus TaxID=78921 RepID=A0A9W8DZK7_9FUNG|nr:hypothetical protein IWQ60_000052 [Tieghemiomyces parasiticus]
MAEIAPQAPPSNTAQPPLLASNTATSTTAEARPIRKDSTAPPLLPQDPTVQRYVEAILANDAEAVRSLLADDRRLTTVRVRGDFKYDRAVELQAFKCLGAYLGALTGLQVAVLTGQTGIAVDIIDATFDQDLDAPFGDRNTVLHLAVLTGDTEITRVLLERGANRNGKNGKGFTAVDLAFHSDIADLLTSVKPPPTQ